MPLGYHDKVLHVDLTSGELEGERPGEAFYRTYMGGSALGAYYLLKMAPAGVDPEPVARPARAASARTGARPPATTRTQSRGARKA